MRSAWVALFACCLVAPISAFAEEATFTAREVEFLLREGEKGCSTCMSIHTNNPMHCGCLDNEIQDECEERLRDLVRDDLEKNPSPPCRDENGSCRRPSDPANGRGTGTCKLNNITQQVNCGLRAEEFCCWNYKLCTYKCE